MESRKPDEARRADAPDGAAADENGTEDPRERRRQRAREAGLQSLVRSLATRPSAPPDR
jgi:hypothetical protein